MARGSRATRRGGSYIADIPHRPDLREPQVSVVFILKREAVVGDIADYRVRDDDGLRVLPYVSSDGRVVYRHTVTEDLDFCCVVAVIDVIGDSDVACCCWDDIADVDLVGDVALGGGVAVDCSIRERVRGVEGVPAGAPSGAGRAGDAGG